LGVGNLRVWAPTFRLPPELIIEVGVNLNGLVCIQVTQSSITGIMHVCLYLNIFQNIENQPILINAHLWRVKSWCPDLQASGPQ
jgi:hypothetical protein